MASMDAFTPQHRENKGDRCWIVNDRDGYAEIEDDVAESRSALADAERRRDAALWKAAAEADRISNLVGKLVERTGMTPQLAADEVISELRMQELIEANPEAFETEDFRIPSEGWEVAEGTYADGSPILVNPEGDAFEITLAWGVKKQLFTFEAALRETEKAGKSIPTETQWYSALQWINRWEEKNWGWVEKFPGYVISEDYPVALRLGLGIGGAIYLNYRTRLEWLPAEWSGRQAGYYWALPESGRPQTPGYVIANLECTSLQRAGWWDRLAKRDNVAMSVRCIRPRTTIDEDEIVDAISNNLAETRKKADQGLWARLSEFLNQ